MDHATFARVQRSMVETREQCGVHALGAMSTAGLANRRECAMSAMIVLIAASKEIAIETKLVSLHQALCAAEVPAKGVLN